MSAASTALQVVTESGFTSRQVDLIKQHIAPGIDDANLLFFGTICQRTGLDPFARQIYIIGRSKWENGREIGKTWTIQTGIDGYRLLAARTGLLAGIDDAIYDDETGDHPGKATVTVWRYMHNQHERVPFTATARWNEYRQVDSKDRLMGQWPKMPYLMLGKCAEALALRKAFPAELSGVYTGEEMAQADNTPEPVAAHIVEERPVRPAPRSPLRPAPKPVDKARTWGNLSARAKAAGMWETAEQWEALLLRVCGITFGRDNATDADKDLVERAIADKEAENRDLAALPAEHIKP
jgi:phage recombination protein Bet